MGVLLQFRRWSQIALSFDGLTFLNLKGDIPTCSPDLTKVSMRLTLIGRIAFSTRRPIEMKKNSGGHPIMKYCRPPWLADEENFSFQIF